MYCNQCEQTAHGTACVDTGVCGKDPDMQSLQETLLYGVKGMASYAHHARRLGKTDERLMPGPDVAVSTLSPAMDAPRQ